MAEPDMGDLRGRRYARQQHDLVAPVELVGFPTAVLSLPLKGARLRSFSRRLASILHTHIF